MEVHDQTADRRQIRPPASPRLKRRIPEVESATAPRNTWILGRVDDLRAADAAKLNHKGIRNGHRVNSGKLSGTWAHPVPQVILPHLDVENPMQPVLDRLVVPDGLQEVPGGHLPAHDLGARLGLDPPFRDADRLDLADRREAGPPVGVLQRADVV